MLGHGILFAEQSLLDSDLSVENPGDQDPGILELIRSPDCAELIIQKYLENPPFHRPPEYPCCNRCDPELQPAVIQELQWIAVNPGALVPKPTKLNIDQESLLLDQLLDWRLDSWRRVWKDRWPSYGPADCISNADLAEVAKHAMKITSIDELRKYVHIIHWETLAGLLFEQLVELRMALGLSMPETADDVVMKDLPVQLRVEPPTARIVGNLAKGEVVINFMS